MSRLNPLTINLKELPPEGQEFTYSSATGELTTTLKDLVGKNPYQIQVKIVPMGNTFDLRGHISSAMDLSCSLCAVDFKYPVEINLRELIVVSKNKSTLGKNDHMAKANHAHEWEAEGPDYILLESPHFNLADYAHEMIALAEPIKPLGRPNCDENCENLSGRVERPWLSYGEDAEGAKTSPFQVLEKIKLKS